MATGKRSFTPAYDWPGIPSAGNRLNVAGVILPVILWVIRLGDPAEQQAERARIGAPDNGHRQTILHTRL